MKKYIIFFVLFFLPEFVYAQTILRANTATVITTQPLYYLGATAASTIPNTTATVTSMNCDLDKNVGTSTMSTSSLSLTASGGNNDCVHVETGHYNIELTAANIETPGWYKLRIAYTGSFMRDMDIIVIDSTTYDLIMNRRPGIATIIGNVTSTQTTHTNMLEDVDAHIASATADIAGVASDIADVSAMVRAGSSLIPTSGCTLPIPRWENNGTTDRQLLFAAISYADATPEIRIEILRNSDRQLRFSTGLAATVYTGGDTVGNFTYAKQAYISTIGNATPWLYLWWLNFPTTENADNYTTIIAAQKQGEWISGTACITNDATPSIDATGIAQASTLSGLIDNASAAFDKLLSGNPNQFNVLVTDTTIPRALAGVSSSDSINAATGDIVGVRSKYVNPFDGTYQKTKHWMLDYIESGGNRAINHEVEGDWQDLIDAILGAGGSSIRNVTEVFTP